MLYLCICVTTQYFVGYFECSNMYILPPYTCSYFFTLTNYIILCLHSVGYGDMTPTTPAGRALAVCIQLSINLILTLPIGKSMYIQCIYTRIYMWLYCVDGYLHMLISYTHLVYSHLHTQSHTYYKGIIDAHFVDIYRLHQLQV